MQWATELRDALTSSACCCTCSRSAPWRRRPARPWYEVLLRLRQRDGRIVLPGAFLPAAERFGLMPLIDGYVLARVIGHLLGPGRANGARLSVNLSGRSLEDPGVIGMIEDYFADPRPSCPAGCAWN